MKIKNIILWAVFSLLNFSCDVENASENCTPNNAISTTSKKEEDEALLQKLYNDIQDIVATKSCKDDGNWFFTGLGTKPCGGPAAYLAYHSAVDVDCLLAKVNHYSTQTAAFQKKYGLISDCSLEPKPTKVYCEDGKPIFAYN
jgi:hypothetical protein